MTTPFQKNINEVSTGGVMHGVDPADNTKANAAKVSAGGGLQVVSGVAASGVVVTTNTTAVAGAFRTITVLADANFSAFTEVGASGQAMTGFVIPAGTDIHGDITAYTLASGKVRAYVK